MTYTANRISRSASSMLGNMLLAATAAMIALAGLVVGGLYLTTHIEETPAMLTLRCLVDRDYPPCPAVQAEMADLRAERLRLIAEMDAIAAERDDVLARLAGLHAIESAVDQITLFQSFTDPQSGNRTTVGTVYTELTGDHPAPERHFCYISLSNGAAGEARNLHIADEHGHADISDRQLARAGLDASGLAFGLSVCRPLLIGDGA